MPLLTGVKNFQQLDTVTTVLHSHYYTVSYDLRKLQMYKKCINKTTATYATRPAEFLFQMAT